MNWEKSKDAELERVILNIRNCLDFKQFLINIALINRYIQHKLFNGFIIWYIQFLA